MTYERKTKDRWDIETNYGYDWECDSSYYDYREAEADYKEYCTHVARYGGICRIVKRNMTYTKETKADGDWITFNETNAKGEKMTLNIRKCVPDLKYKKSLMNLWVKNGWLEKPLETYWSTNTYVDKPDGTCYYAYDPQSINYKKYDSKGNTVEDRYVINFDWILEATPENYDNIVAEVGRRFMNMILTLKKEEVAECTRQEKKWK